MTAENGTSETSVLIQRGSLLKHPCSGVFASKPPENRHSEQATDSKRYAGLMGQICQKAVWKAWTCPSPLSADTCLIGASQLVREKIRSQIPGTARLNSQIEPAYQALTLAPEIVFSGDERTTPSWEPLTTLFTKVDQMFPGSNLLDKFAQFYEPDPTQDPINRKFRFLVETALILSRLATEQSPFGNVDFVPNVWTSDIVQFDGVLIPKGSQNHKFDLIKHWQNLLAWWPIEVKVDNRARFVTGIYPGNILDFHPHVRHMREFQDKCFAVVSKIGNDFQLPYGFTYIYLRGLLPHAVHATALNESFLTHWLLGLDTSLNNNLIPPEKQKAARKLKRIIETRINLLEKEERGRKRAAKKGYPIVNPSQPDLIETSELIKDVEPSPNSKIKRRTKGYQPSLIENLPTGWGRKREWPKDSESGHFYKLPT